MMQTFTCTNADCPENGIGKDIDYDAIKAVDAENGVTTGPVICGSCGSDITASGETQVNPT